MPQILCLHILAWSPLCGGLLTGKYGPGLGAGEEKRLDKTSFEVSEKRLMIAEELRKLAHELGRSPAQVALAWTRKRSIPILGARTLGQFQDNLRCLDFQLTPDQEERLNQA